MSIETEPNGSSKAGADLDPERMAFEAAQREDAAREQREDVVRPAQAALPVSTSELVLGLLGLVTWFGLFSGGILISTEPYRAVLQTPTQVSQTVVSLIVVSLFWTITNVGVLSCVAAFLGALGRRTHFTLGTDLVPAVHPVPQPDLQGLGTYYVSAIMRGFGIYTLVLAGLLVLATESLASPTQAAYMRLAPTISIISFYGGYDPTMFAGLLDRVKTLLQTNNKQSS